MFAAIPISTDAPAYHFPYTTIGLILVNTVVFCLTASVAPDQLRPWMAVYGNGLHPVQWVTSCFLHANLPHLLFNMIGLWTFGLVVEGKLGWRRFLAVYLSIGIVAKIIAQLAFLGLDVPRYSLGASGCIYGVMALALIWAPLNEIQFVGVFVFFGVRVIEFEWTILFCAGLDIVTDLFFLGMKGVRPSSEFSHIAGAFVGGIVGITLLKKNLVDCENWDVFAVMEGRKGKTREEAAATPRRKQVEYEPPADLPGAVAPLADPGEAKASPAKLREKLMALISAGKTHAAIAMYERLDQLDSSDVLPEPALLKMIELLYAEKRWGESVPFLEQYLSTYQEKEIPIRLRLAQVLIEHQQRPSYGLRVLDPLPENLGLRFAPLRDSLTAKARQLIDDGVLELDGRGW